MEAENSNHVSYIFKELNKTIEVIGSDKLIEILKDLRKKQQDITEEQIKKALQITQIVCDEFDITLEDFFGTKRNNNRRFAIGVCSMFLHKELGLDNVNISFILKKSDALISVYKHEIFRLNNNHPMDKQILIKIDKITDNLKNKIQ